MVYGRPPASPCVGGIEGTGRAAAVLRTRNAGLGASAFYLLPGGVSIYPEKKMESYSLQLSHARPTRFLSPLPEVLGLGAVIRLLPEAGDAFSSGHSILHCRK